MACPVYPIAPIKASKGITVTGTKIARPNCSKPV
ncbi:hypothetical protein MCCPILRI181_00925 [Mycoplasma capricolum subsp. capripneumoniae]|nr:hypothetical protein Mccp14020TZ_09280 [Mycoplasma capricolum subsp. capripneumoniae]CEA11265.1 hypothetical protein MCCPILRI181_00925 [Mycoplasma capricolum subsp. capripneumoniae]CEA12263.1 hypothetical protein MCCPF38_00925 [Mycoplasma capricolum subsp. capripneumoniae]